MRTAGALAVLACITPVSTAFGQEASSQLEEVVVTAQKRVESLQSVPVSVQVVSAVQLMQQNQNSLQEMTETLPAVHIQSGFFSDSLFIRGIGSGNNAGFDQSVATFSDDVYKGRSRMTNDLFIDLDRIEVLKGPQSTFFGNSAIAGALNIVSKSPGDQFDAWGRALYGMFGQFALEGAAGGPITDTFGLRIAGTYNGTNGWIDNVNINEHVPSVRNYGGRITAVFKPTDDLHATLKVSAGSHSTEGSAGDQPIQWKCPPPAPYPPSIFSLFGQGGCLTVAADGLPNDYNAKSNSELDGQGNFLSNFDSALTINYNKWGQTFTSVTGFYNYHYHQLLSESGLPLFTATNDFYEKYNQVSQEFRVASPTGGTFEYLAGLYYQSDTLNNLAGAVAPELNFIASVPGFEPLAPYLPFGPHSVFEQDEKIESVFGSVSWNVNDQLKLTGGLRGSWVQKDGSIDLSYYHSTEVYGGGAPMPPDVQPLASFILGPPGTTYLKTSNDAWMPSARIQYQVNPDVMTYFAFNRGFKAGGFNAVLPGGSLPSDGIYGPEKVNDYELGLKSEWLNKTLLVNFNLFRSKYDGLQTNASVLNPVTKLYSFLIRNVADALSQGAELEAEWVATDNFRLSANVTFLDAHYVSFPNAGPTQLQSYCGELTQAQYAAVPECARFPFPVQTNNSDASGQPTPYSPKWSGTIAATYTASLPGGYRLTTQLTPYFTTSYNQDPDGILPSLGDYVRLDARLSLQLPDPRWNIDIIGKNLTDQYIRTSYSSGQFTKEEPRNVAAQVRFKW
jgi:outer membrane receptor protein involved in Fe transport